MSTRLIPLDNDIQVEVRTFGDDLQQVSGGFVEKNLDKALGLIKPALLKFSRPVIDAIEELNKEAHVEVGQVEIEMGLSFDNECDIYITKNALNANVSVKMTLQKKS